MDIGIPIPTPKEKRKISFRNLKSIPPSTFLSALTNRMSASPVPSSGNPSELVNFYNHTLSSYLDHLAPIRTKHVTFKHSAPWYTTELHHMKAHKRQLERLCKKTTLMSTVKPMPTTFIDTKIPSTQPSPPTTQASTPAHPTPMLSSPLSTSSSNPMTISQTPSQP
ncbi:uncharacterized protein V6R79_009449 [Siganus canaliculatus]